MPYALHSWFPISLEGFVLTIWFERVSIAPLIRNKGNNAAHTLRFLRQSAA